MIWKYFPHWDSRDGVSAVIICSARAEQILSNISGELVLKIVTEATHPAAQSSLRAS